MLSNLTCATATTWQQPAVQKFLKGILQNSGTGAYYAWKEEAQRERMARMRNVQNLMKLREAEAAIERGRLERVKQIMQCILQREVVKVGLYSCIQFNHSVEAPGSTLEPIK